MIFKDTIRLSGSQKFVTEIGDIIIETLKQKGHRCKDGGARDSNNPKYTGNFIRYINIEK
jgi:hypothetical protein